MDAELYERVSSIVRDETQDLVSTGRVKIEEEISNGSDWSARIRLLPRREGAADLDMTVYGDTVSFGAGPSEAYSEIWTTADADWETHLRQIIRCVRAGRYSERVRKGGWFFPLRIDMRFAGVPSGKGLKRSADTTIKYAFTLESSEGRLPMPPTGEFTFEPW